MKLKDLTKKLQSKPNQNAEVNFLVFEEKTNAIVCVDLSGPKTRQIIEILGRSQSASLPKSSGASSVEKKGEAV